MLGYLHGSRLLLGTAESIVTKIARCHLLHFLHGVYQNFAGYFTKFTERKKVKKTK
jgi:hypothetical protein